MKRCPAMNPWSEDSEVVPVRNTVWFAASTDRTFIIGIVQSSKS